MSRERWVQAVKQKRCWITGEKLGRYMTFVVGPMCGINRTSAEPPSKKVNAIYAAKICPFLAQPKMIRNEKGLSAETVAYPDGTFIKRNPGVAMLWTTRNYSLFDDQNGGMLIQMGDPEDVMWFCEGREATREEVMHSIETGLPLLQKVAEEDGDMDALNECIERFMPLVPAD